MYTLYWKGNKGKMKRAFRCGKCTALAVDLYVE